MILTIPSDHGDQLVEIESYCHEPNFQTYWVGQIIDRPIIAQGDTMLECIDELLMLLDCVIDYEIIQLMKA